MKQRRVGRILVLLGLLIAYGRYPRLIYGESYEKNCSTNCKQPGSKRAPCDRDTGECYEGCIPGYHGLTCNFKCGNCFKNICNAHNGHCSQGCNSCFCGDYCNITCTFATCRTDITTPTPTPTPTPRKMSTPTPTPTKISTRMPKPVSPSVMASVTIDISRYMSTSALAARYGTKFGTYSSASKNASPNSGSSTSSPTPVHNGHSIEIIGTLIAALLMVLIVLMVVLLCYRSNMFTKRTEKNSSPSQTNEETEFVDECQLVTRYYEINDEDIDHDATTHNIEHREMPYSVTTVNSVYEKLNSHSRVNCESLVVNVMSNTDGGIIDPVAKYLDPVEI